MLKRFSVLLFMLALMGCFSLKSMAQSSHLEVSNGYFSFTMPNDTKDIYTASKTGNKISIFEKNSQKIGAGGFAFSLEIYKNPGDYVQEEDTRKIGELVDKKGNIYDMVLIKPTAMRYGGGENAEANYNRLYEVANNVEIKGINGNKYIKGQGTKGENLYGEILNMHQNTIKNKWGYSEYVESGLGPKYALWLNKDLPKKIGYAYYDINNDGIDELLIGEIAKGKLKGNIFNVYTMVDRKPVRILSASVNSKYFVCSNRCLCRETATASKDKFFDVFFLKKNSSKITILYKYMYSADSDKNNHWQKGHTAQGEWKNISKENYNKEINGYTNSYKRFDFDRLIKAE